MSILHISDHFAWSEASCHSGAEVPLSLQPHARHLALAVLEPLRARRGDALVVISWYRAPWYNQQVGGAAHSQHLLANAADIRTADIDQLPRLRAVLEDMLHETALPDLGGWGWYPGRWIHVDCGPRRPDGQPRHWVGRGVGGEETG